VGRADRRGILLRRGGDLVVGCGVSRDWGGLILN